MDDDEDKKDGWLVDHGYLSDGEGEEDESHPNETEEERQRRLAKKAEEWKESLRQKEKRLKKQKLVPNVYGPSWKKANEDEIPHLMFRHLRLSGVTFEYSD